MRVYFDFSRMLTELKDLGRLREVDVTVAAFSVLGMICGSLAGFAKGGVSRNSRWPTRSRDCPRRPAAAAGGPPTSAPFLIVRSMNRRRCSLARHGRFLALIS